MDYEIIQNYVTFFSPGTFVAETSQMKIDEWNIEKAVDMARGVTERYNAKPYGFQFSTRARKPGELDAKTIDTSKMFYIGGRIETLEEIKNRRDPKDDILISNMQTNHWDRVVVNENSWRIVQPLAPGDVVLDIKL